MLLGAGIWALGSSSMGLSQLEIKLEVVLPPVSHLYILKGGEAKKKTNARPAGVLTN